MTDKQIIIDGVDVSGCNYGEIEKSIFKCSCEYNVCSASMFCEDNPDCYYKQLKRKEQECERLKEGLSQIQNTSMSLTKHFNLLNAENEQYKKVISKLAGKTIAIITYDTPIEFCDHKDLTIQQLKKENEKLKEEKQGLIKDWEEKKNLAYEIACKNEKLKEENEELKKEIDNKFSVSGFNVIFMREHIHNLKQTLAEIKEVAKKETQPYSETWRVDGYSEILQKIREVEDETTK